MKNNQTIITRIDESIDVLRRVMASSILVQTISDVADLIIRCISDGGKIIICGNGGSASDASHFSGEIVGRFMTDRNPWPAIALNSNDVIMTSIANDYGYEEVFARQVDGMAKFGDVFIGISTSGNSENVFRGVAKAKEKGVTTVSLLGKGGGRIADVSDYSMIIPSDDTARIQEAHILIIHILCEIVEKKLYRNEK